MKILEINNLKKTYSNGKEALKGVSLEINKGEFIALLGPNGAGKSTLINILSDLVIKTSGSVKLGNYDLDENKLDFKRHIGIVPQDINFDPFFTPYEVLLLQQGFYGLRKDTDKIHELIEAMGLKDQINTNSRQLSGGMKRRLLVAKALIHDPDIIILDEPTAGVDVELRQHLWEYLRKLNAQGKTIILTTHYLEEAEQLCDKIAIINQGQLITYSTKAELMKKVGQQSLEITTDKAISDVSFVSQWKYKQLNNNIIEFAYKDGSEIAKIIQALANNDVGINNINIKKSSLEEVFLKLTA